MNYSAEDLGKALSVSGATVSRWERNIHEPDDEMKKKLSDLLNINIAYLMGIDESAGEYPLELVAPRSETAEMFAKLMKKLAAENPDLIIHFRDLEKNFDKLSLGDIQTIAYSIALIIGKANKEVEKD